MSHKTFHIVGAIGFLLTALAPIITLSSVGWYAVNTASAVIGMILSLGAYGCCIAYFFGAGVISYDGLIKAGCLVAGIGYCVALLGAFLLLAGAYVPVISLLGSIAALVGMILWGVKLIMLYPGDAAVILLCVFGFLGMVLGLCGIVWGDVITGGSFSGLLFYFCQRNVSY